MATQPNEVFFTDYYYVNHFDNNKLMLAIAEALSASNHFNIIDSYSSAGGVGRYKGDPVANSIWETYEDVGENNDWFVIECQTEHTGLAALGFTGLPKWQLKFQWCTSGTALADVSDPTGAKYPKNHNVQNYTWSRFGPYGGWDQEDIEPDFDPVSPPASGDISSGNHTFRFSEGYVIVVCVDGCLIILQREEEGRYHNVALCAGDVLPPSTTHMPMPRSQYANGSGMYGGPSGIDHLGSYGFLVEAGQWSNSNGLDYETTEGSNGGMVYWNEGENLIETAYMSHRCKSLVKKHGNHHAPGMEVDTFPFLVMPKKDNYGARFALSHIRKGWGHGTLVMSSKTLMSGQKDFSAIFPWDGSSGAMR